MFQKSFLKTIFIGRKDRKFSFSSINQPHSSTLSSFSKKHKIFHADAVIENLFRKAKPHGTHTKSFNIFIYLLSSPMLLQVLSLSLTHSLPTWSSFQCCSLEESRVLFNNKFSSSLSHDIISILLFCYVHSILFLLLLSQCSIEKFHSIFIHCLKRRN